MRYYLFQALLQFIFYFHVTDQRSFDAVNSAAAHRVVSDMNYILLRGNGFVVDCRFWILDRL